MTPGTRESQTRCPGLHPPLSVGGCHAYKIFLFICQRRASRAGSTLLFITGPTSNISLFTPVLIPSPSPPSLVNTLRSCVPGKSTTPLNLNHPTKRRILYPSLPNQRAFPPPPLFLIDLFRETRGRDCCCNIFPFAYELRIIKRDLDARERNG